MSQSGQIHMVLCGKTSPLRAPVRLCLRFDTDRGRRAEHRKAWGHCEFRVTDMQDQSRDEDAPWIR